MLSGHAWSRGNNAAAVTKLVTAAAFPSACSSSEPVQQLTTTVSAEEPVQVKKKEKVSKNRLSVRITGFCDRCALIPNKKSKAGKMLRFFRFERPKAHTIQNEKPVAPVKVPAFKQPNATYQGGPKGHVLASLLQPSLVLDDSCLVDIDLANCVMGEVRQFSSINNLQLYGFDISVMHNLISLLKNDSTKTSSRVLEEVEKSVDRISSDSFSNGIKIKEGGSILELLEEMIYEWVKTMGFFYEGCTKDMEKDYWNSRRTSGFPMNCLSLNVQGLGSKAKKDWIKELISKHKFRCSEERWGLVYDSIGANAFNSFISNLGLNDIQLEGYSFTWDHPSATKMSKLDRFLMSNGFLSAFPYISAVCLDRHLSDHRPNLLKEVSSDFGPSPFHFFHSWLNFPGFNELVSKSWNSFALDDSNGMIRFKKKLQLLKKEIRTWIMDFKRHQMGLSVDLKSKLCDIDKTLDQGGVSEEILLSRMEVLKQLHTFKGIMVDGDWIVDPDLVKQEFRNHFADRFQDPGPRRGCINFPFPSVLVMIGLRIGSYRSQTMDILAQPFMGVSRCVDNLPGPDGSVTFEFFASFGTSIGPDFCLP
ncbi:RNA-directed DNA polymerase, eukaryota [Tanacetum coccineum]|uniref:RNA-directed DNA polymerase, eukaryota n=1 Tax=Tanacetum coccineum TaxID=301880 RepID=A0ABQ5HR88_9ASTR